MTKVDFFSLDVEGAEESVLETADPSVRVGVLLVEKATDGVCRRLVRGRGMVQVAAGVGQGALNSIWAAPPEAARFREVSQLSD